MNDGIKGDFYFLEYSFLYCMDFYSVTLHYFYYQHPLPPQKKKKLASFSHFEEKLIIIKCIKKGSVWGFFFPLQSSIFKNEKVNSAYFGSTYT